MYIYIHISIYANMYTYIHVYDDTCIHKYACVLVCIHICI